MPIEIQPANLTGPAYLAGVREGSLNLASSANQVSQGAQRAVEAQRNNIAAAASRQAGQLGLLSNQLEQQKMQQQGLFNQGQLANQQQATAQQGQYQQGQLANQQQAQQQQSQQEQQQNALQQGQLANAQQQTAQTGQYQQGELANTQQANALKVQQQHVKDLAASSQADIDNRGILAATTRMAIANAKTPEQANQIRAQSLQQAVDKGYMSKEQAAQAGQGPISQYNALLDGYTVMAGHASDLKSALESEKLMGTNTGGTTLPDGTMVSPLTATERSQTQKDLVNAQTNLAQFQKLNGAVKDNWFGQAANWSGPEMTKWQLKQQGLPVIGHAIPTPSAADVKDLETYSNFQSNATAQIMNTARALMGGRFNNNELKLVQSVVPTIGPTVTRAEFNGRMQQIQDSLNNIVTQKQDLLKRGIKLSDKDEENMFTQAFSGGAGTGQQQAGTGQQQAGTGQQQTSKAPLPGESKQAYLIRMGHSQDNVSSHLEGQQ